MLRRLLLLLVWLSLVLALLPASLLDALLQQASGGLIHLTATRGYWWRGEGLLQLSLPNGDAATLHALRWRFTGKALEAADRDGQPALQLRLLPQPRLERLRVTFPAQALGHLSATLRAAGLAGSLSLELRDTALQQGRIQAGSGELLWRDAVSSLSGGRPLGSYRITLNAVDGGLQLRLSTLQGALRLEGGGRWTPGQAPAFSGAAWPEPEQAAALLPLLRVLGQETEPQRFRLVLDANAGMTRRR